jgi:hypothetical protein
MTEPTTDPGAGAMTMAAMSPKERKIVHRAALMLSAQDWYYRLDESLDRLFAALSDAGYVIEKANGDDDRAARTLADIFGDEWGGISGEPDIAWEDAEEEDREMWRSVTRRFIDYLAARPDGAR